MPDETQIEAQSQDNSETGDATGPAAGQQDGGETPGERRFSQADLDRVVEERLKREKAKAESAAQKAKEKAEAEALANQEKWKELAEKNGSTLTQIQTELEAKAGELETAAQRVERLEKALQAQLTSAKDGLPEAVLELVNRLDPVDQLEYLAKHKTSLGVKNGTGVPASPKPADEGAVSTEQKQTSARRLGAQIRNWM